MSRIKDYFTFNQKERRGIIVLLVIIMLLFAGRILMPYLVSNDTAIDPDLKAETEAFSKSLKAEKKTAEKKLYSTGKAEPYPVEEFNLFPFDPNELPRKKWLVMNMDPQLVNTIKNYLEKGGHFYKKEDLKKIYGMSNEVYTALEPYIRISKTDADNDREEASPAYANIPDSVKKRKKHWKPITVDVNASDTVQMMRLKGVGAYYARRILKFRDMLGGFATKAQLLEVYGIDSARYLQFESQIQLNDTLIKQININEASLDQLKGHPYLDYYVAKSIVDRRIIHGTYKQIDEIKNIDLMHNDLYNRVRPYLCVSNPANRKMK